MSTPARRRARWARWLPEPLPRVASTRVASTVWAAPPPIRRRHHRRARSRRWRRRRRVPRRPRRRRSRSDGGGSGARPSALGDRDGLLRTLLHRLLTPLAQLVRRVLLQEVEVVVVPDLE